MRIKEIRTGREVNVPDRIGDLLVIKGKHEYVTSATTAEVEADISPRTGRPKRQYKRRDMKADLG